MQQLKQTTDKALTDARVWRGAALLLALAVAASLLLMGSRARATDYIERLNPGGVLYPGESLWSPSRLYRFTQQHDGNLVLYSMPGNKPFWASGTFSRDSVTRMQPDGNLVIYAPGNVAVWSTRTDGHRNSVLFMQDDANVVLRAPGNVPIWATNAQHIAGCTDGSRTQASQYAAAGQFYVPVPRVAWTEDPPVGPKGGGVTAVIELRYNPAVRCAWALFTGPGFLGGGVWMDRSTDGGRTWDNGSMLGLRYPNTAGSWHTGVFNDSYPYVMRACGKNINEIRCTAWF